MLLTIPGTLPGLNEITNTARTNKYLAAKQKKSNTEMVAWAAKMNKIPKMQRATLNITWYEPNKKRDPDNVQAAVKFIWDGLVLAGVLENDGWKQQGQVTHDMQVDKTNPRIEIELKEANHES